jgi:Uncharacterised nucleotidyltransferase
MNANIDLPPARILQETLRKITERLASELASPGTVAPDWSDFEWQLARAVAAMHGVSPLLAIGLQWEPPPGWRAFLETQRAHVAARHRRIEELLNQLDTRCAEEGIAIVALKGAALHTMGFYRMGERPMADVDLLVQSRDVPRAGEVLESLGFSELYQNWKHKVFEPKVRGIHAGLGEHAQNHLKIELHERIAERLPVRAIDVTDLVFPRQPHSGLNTYPSKTALLLHLLIHAANAMTNRALRLLHLHDIALVAARMSSADWGELLKYELHGGPWWALPPLRLTARYYFDAIPKDVLAAISEQCPWPLRRITGRQSLSDVSLSSPWIQAFPGIAWSRSGAEIMEYIACRIWPDEEQLRQRDLAVETEAVAPREWSRLSQGGRILRWLMFRQARADTLNAVRMALAPPQPRA